MRALSFEQALDGPFAPAMQDFDATSWRPFLRSLDGNPPSEQFGSPDQKRPKRSNVSENDGEQFGSPDQQSLFEACTGRVEPFTSPPRSAQACCGRRSGKTRIAALIAATSACFWDHSYLTRGERGRVMLLSQTRDQAQVARGYVLDLLESDPVTKSMITGTTAEMISLSNQIDVAIQAASFRSTRGWSIPAIIADEVALWRDTESSVNPAREIFRALTPGQIAVPQPLLLSISTPFSKEGYFYEQHQKHFGDDESATLCWQAASKAMNPTLPQAVIDAAYADDPQSAAAEYGAEFRSDIASFIDRDVVLDCVEKGLAQRPYLAGTKYVAFCDPSSGSKDSFALAIAHREDDQAILDDLQEWKAPFDPMVVIGLVAEALKAYQVSSVHGDRYAQGFVVSAFSSAGITYVHSTRDRSQIYLAALPMLNARRMQLLDNTRLVNQLAGLQRRTSSTGKQTVDHARNGADDAANAACGALVLTTDQAATMVFGPAYVYSAPRDFPGSGSCTPDYGFPGHGPADWGY